MKYAIISDPNHSVGGRYEFHVHLAGCRDIKKHQRTPGYQMAGSTNTVEAMSAEEAVALEVEAYAANQQDWYAEHFHIYPCCRQKPRPAQPPADVLLVVAASTDEKSYKIDLLCGSLPWRTTNTERMYVLAPDVARRAAGEIRQQLGFLTEIAPFPQGV